MKDLISRAKKNINDSDMKKSSKEEVIEVIDRLYSAMTTKLIPVAERITSWKPNTEIIYKCPVPKCQTIFSHLGKNERFCHNCGTWINWDAVQINLNEPFKGSYEEEKALINQINIRQIPNYNENI